jgi:hypothetical protein
MESESEEKKIARIIINTIKNGKFEDPKEEDEDKPLMRHSIV